MIQKIMPSWRLIETVMLGLLFFLPWSKSITEALVWTALGLWFLRRLCRSRESGNQPDPRLRGDDVLARWSYGIFLAITLASIFQAGPGEWTTALRGFFKWFKYIALFFMAGELYEDESRRERAVGMVLIMLFLLCADGFWQMATGADLVKGYLRDLPSRVPRMTASLQSPNSLAAFVYMGLPLIFWVWRARKPKNIGLALFILLAGAALFLTYSRAGVFAFFASVLIYVLLRKPWMAIPIAAAPMAVVLSIGTLRQNFLQSLSLEDITIGERLRYWQTTWKMIEASPILGHGVNLFYQTFPRFAPADEAYRGYAHNCYLQMWAEVGILGLIAFLVPFLAWIPKAFITEDRKAFTLRGALAIGAAAFLMQSFADTHFYSLQTAILFWIFWGMFAGSTRAPQTS